MFGVSSQAAQNVGVAQDHRESLIGCADSAGDHCLSPRPAQSAARRFGGRAGMTRPVTTGISSGPVNVDVAE